MTADLDPRTHAKRGDPDTSHAAAARLGSKTTVLAQILGTYLEHDRTAQEASAVAGFSYQQGAKRVSDLLNQGLITDTGRRRVGTFGREQMVCAITRAGVVQLARWSR